MRNKDFRLHTRFNTVTYSKHTFRYFGPLLWKRLNNEVKQSPSLQSFRNAIRNLDISGMFFYQLRQKKKKKPKQTNKQTERTLAGTPQQLWPITLDQDTNKKGKRRNIKKTQRYKKNYNYIQQVIERDKGRALLHFKQIDLNERGSSQS